MLARLASVAVHGIEAVLLEVEVDLGRGLPGTVILGLPDKAVNESRDRVKAAVLNGGYDFPARRITVNMAPADLKKEGPAYDLPIALGILAAAGTLKPGPRAGTGQTAWIGELSLEGRLRGRPSLCSRSSPAWRSAASRPSSSRSRWTSAGAFRAPSSWDCPTRR